MDGPKCGKGSKEKAMKFYPMPPTSIKWIRTRLKERYTEREAEEKFEEINSLYEQFVARSPDIGGKKNPMSKNLYGAFSAFAYYECTGRSMSPEEITDMCYGMMMAGRGNQRPLEKLDLNNRLVRGILHGLFGMRARRLNKHKKDGSWNNTWGMKVNPQKRKEGISIHLVGCPIADFARETGYGELMPYFCEADGAVMEALGGTLHRDHTVAEGFEECDYWIKNKED